MNTPPTASGDALPRWWLGLVTLLVGLQFAWWITAPSIPQRDSLRGFRSELSWLDSEDVRARRATRLWSPALYALPGAVGFVPTEEPDTWSWGEDLLRPPEPEGILARRDEYPVLPRTPRETEELQRMIAQYLADDSVAPAGQRIVLENELRCAIAVSPPVWVLDKALLEEWMTDNPALPLRGSVQFEAHINEERLVEELFLVGRIGEPAIESKLLAWVRAALHRAAEPGRASIRIEWMKSGATVPSTTETGS